MCIELSRACSFSAILPIFNPATPKLPNILKVLYASQKKIKMFFVIGRLQSISGEMRAMIQFQNIIYWRTANRDVTTLHKNVSQGEIRAFIYYLLIRVDSAKLSFCLPLYFFPMSISINKIECQTKTLIKRSDLIAPIDARTHFFSTDTRQKQVEE